MKHLFLYIIFVVLFISCNAQANKSSGRNKPGTDTLRLFQFFPGDYSLAEVDETESIYLLTANCQLKKMNSNGDSIAVFNDVRRYGKVSYIDVSNPLRTIVFYKNFSTILLLDRLLSLRTSLNLRKQQVFKVNAVTSSYDNNLWFFDEQDFKLKKTDEQGSVLLESIDLRTAIDDLPSPVFITDKNNFVYLYDPGKGLYIFDHYAAFINKIPIIKWSSVNVSQNKLIGISENMIHVYNLENKLISTYKLPSGINNPESLRVINNKLYILTAAGLTVFRFP